MINVIDADEYNKWADNLDNIKKNLDINNSVSLSISKGQLINDEDYSAIIEEISTIKNNQYGQYYNNWDNYATLLNSENEIKDSTLVKEYKIEELLNDLNEMCGNVVSGNYNQFTSYSVVQTDVKRTSQRIENSTIEYTGNGLQQCIKTGYTQATGFYTENSGKNLQGVSNRNVSNTKDANTGTTNSTIKGSHRGCGEKQRIGNSKTTYIGYAVNKQEENI